MFDRDHRSCMKKTCARPSLPPYLLYKVSKFRCDVSLPFHCHLPSSLHPVRDGGKKHQHRAKTMGSREPWEEHSGWVFFFAVLLWLYLHSFFSPPCPFPASLLCSVSVHEPSLKWAAEGMCSSSCHGQLGAGVSSNVSFGFRQELKWWDFSPCCTLSFHESCALRWNITLPVKPYLDSPVLNSCTHTPKSHGLEVVLLTNGVNLTQPATENTSQTGNCGLPSRSLGKQ